MKVIIGLSRSGCYL